VKKESSILLLVIILMAASPAIPAVAEAQTSTEKVRFKALAAGPCFVGLGDPYPIGLNYTTGWCGLGEGTVWIHGWAEGELIEYPYEGEIFYSSSVKARAFISVRWIKNDGSRHRLIVMLYSQENTEGLFNDTFDNFAIPAPGETPPEVTVKKYLRYRGIYINDTEIQRIDGFASIFSYGLPPVAPPLINIYLLWGENLQRVFLVSWLSEELTVSEPDLGIPKMTIPAARIFRRNVELINSA